MKALPLIGVTCSQPMEKEMGRLFNGTSRNFAEGVAEVGGLPVMLPNVPDLAEDFANKVDAVLFTGGVDLHPQYFGQHPRRGLGTVDEVRDTFETALYRAIRKQGKPIFGVCRGFQMMNALEGGTLHQHLPDVPDFWIDHSQVAMAPVLGHEVRFIEGSLLGELHGEKCLVNSYHHQAVDQVAPGLKVAAVAPDGLVEALEGEGLMGVQWHPELLWQAHRFTLASFEAFMRLLN